MKQDTPGTDVEELKRLASSASQAGHCDQAIRYLKQARQIAPADGMITYLLAAEHARLGIYPHAMAELELALEQAPELAVARFQLGFLKLAAGDDQAARRILLPLSELGEDSCFHHFQQGLEHLVEERFDACRQALERGLERNSEHPAVNGDIEKVLRAIEDRREPPAPRGRKAATHG